MNFLLTCPSKRTAQRHIDLTWPRKQNNYLWCNYCATIFQLHITDLKMEAYRMENKGTKKKKKDEQIQLSKLVPYINILHHL
jgi:hypothetical protein